MLGWSLRELTLKRNLQVAHPTTTLSWSSLILAILASAFAASTINAQDPVPSDPPLQWWKGNIHTHSLWSDGNDFPEMISEWYRAHDYNFLALSDHNILSVGDRWMKHAAIVQRGGKDALDKYRARFGKHWVETRGKPDSDQFAVRLKPLEEFRGLVEERGRFIMIQGEEISDSAEGKPVHMNATNVGELIRPAGGKTVRETMENNLRSVEEQAKRLNREIMVHLNHPNFGLAVTAEDLAAVTRERFFEVYNGHPGVKHLGDAKHPGVERQWDIANTIRIAQLNAPIMFGVATDDGHYYHGRPGSHPGRGWIMVRSRYLTPEHLIRAIKAGDYYCSSGVTLKQLEFSKETKTISVKIDPKPGATYSIQFVGTRTGFDPESKPRLGDNGKPIKSTRIYSKDIGMVLASGTGTEMTYEIDGDELFVRAVITSSQAHPDPSFSDQKQQAWTQPFVPAR